MKALIEKKLEGCNKKFTINKYTGFCGEKRGINPIKYCPSCKSYLQGIKDSLKDELEFLNGFGKNFKKKYDGFNYINYRIKKISELIKLLEGKGI